MFKQSIKKQIIYQVLTSSVFTSAMALNTIVAPTPKANINRYGRDFRLKPFLFSIRKLKILIFF
jgi:hypothetical protein